MSSSQASSSQSPRQRSPSGTAASRRRRQSSLSSQLSSVTTFDSESDQDEGDENNDADAEGSIAGSLGRDGRSRTVSSASGTSTFASKNDMRTLANKRRSGGFFLASPITSPAPSEISDDGEEANPYESSYAAIGPNLPVPPSHRLSTTPLFPSPLAHALSANVDDDSVEMMDIDEDISPTSIKQQMFPDEADSFASEMDISGATTVIKSLLPDRQPSPSRSWGEGSPSSYRASSPLRQMTSPVGLGALPYMQQLASADSGHTQTKIVDPYLPRGPS